MLHARDKKKTRHLTNCRLQIEPLWADSFPLHTCFPEREREERETPRPEKWASHASAFAYEIMRERQHLVSPTAARRQRQRRRNRLGAAEAATSCMMIMMVQELQLLMDRVWRIIFTMNCVKFPRPRPRPHLRLLLMEIVCMRPSSG